MSSTRLQISKLDDGADTSRLEKAREAVPGIRSVEINPAGNEARVQHDGPDPEKCIQAIRDEGDVSEVA